MFVKSEPNTKQIDDVELTISITMKISEWKKITNEFDNITRWPVGPFRAAISQAFGQIQKILTSSLRYETHGGME